MVHFLFSAGGTPLRIWDWDGSGGHGRDGTFVAVQKAPSAWWAFPMSHDGSHNGRDFQNWVCLQLNSYVFMEGLGPFKNQAIYLGA